MQSYLAELKILGRLLLRFAVAVMLLAGFFFSANFERAVVWGTAVWIPILTTHSIAASIFNRMARDLVPQNVHIVVTSPLSAFLLETEIAFLFAAVILLPFLVLHLVRFLSPALYVRERRALWGMMLPSLALFAAGAFFAYAVIIPPMFSFLYTYVPAIDAEALYAAPDFLGNALSLMVTAGFMFELPIIMLLATYFGIISASFWRRHWRYAVLTFLIATAIITPDGTGITMLLLTAPLCVLYFLGLALSERHERRRKVEPRVSA